MDPLFRPNTNDAEIWREVYEENEYRVPDDLRGKHVWDIGGHIGAFALRCRASGAAIVTSSEPARDNRLSYMNNVSEWRTTLLPFAVWNKTGPMRLVHCPQAGNMAGHTLMLHEDRGDGEDVWAVAFADLLKILPPVDWCKIDAEGAEYVILNQPAAVLLKIPHYTVEFHETDHRRGWQYQQAVDSMKFLGYRVAWETVRNQKIRVTDFVRG